ncbi:MAG: TrbI/VirB10 family protein [Rickettsiales bacterium]|nr:TrbI/VirB10 family protein [Rickettsiales bacterium]
MSSLKQSFSELKKSTPKNVQWLLMAAAFVIVLILLTLLLTGKKNNNSAATKSPAADAAPAALKITPNELDWTNIQVGDAVSQKFTVSATAPAKISAVRLSKEIAGLSKKSTCETVAQVSDIVSCTINLDYKPANAVDISAVALLIDWRASTQPEKMNKTEKVAIAIGATGKAQVQEKAAEPEITTPPAPKAEIKKELEAIAPAFSFDDDDIDDEEIEEPAPKPALKPAEKPVSKPAAPAAAAQPAAVSANDCSEFAIAGYGPSGQQIGWIRPDRGGYKFHPFADSDCTAPTGIYNPDNGIIMDIKNPMKKIGTDAEHIGYGNFNNGVLPKLSNPVATKNENRSRQLDARDIDKYQIAGSKTVFTAPKPVNELTPPGNVKYSSKPYDRTFVLRQYKPIPATIVNEIRADVNTLAGNLPVRATVDRNVYSDNGRTVIIPAGTLLLGYVTGNLPGPYKTIGRMDVRWYQFIRPDGVEFSFGGPDGPFSGDSQGRVGVPGRGSTDYIEQFVMPMLTAIVPAAVNMIAPISDKFVNQIDLDNNTVTQTGQVRSSELAKNEIITTWNKIAQKLMVDMMDNTTPPFSIAAGTRITVFSPIDLAMTCGDGGDKKCSIAAFGAGGGSMPGHSATPDYNDGTWTGQVRSFDLQQYCDGTTGKVKSGSEAAIQAAGMDYRTVLFYCQSQQYQAINNVKAAAVFDNQKSSSNEKSISNAGGVGSQTYNEKVLGLKYNDDGSIKNPFQKEAPPPVAAPVITCEDGTVPDGNGCCTGETFDTTVVSADTPNGACCPAGGGDCFPPIL